MNKKILLVTHTHTQPIYRNLCVHYYYHYFIKNFAWNYVCVCVQNNKRKCVCLKFENMIFGFENNQWIFLYTPTHIHTNKIYTNIFVCVSFIIIILLKILNYKMFVCIILFLCFIIIWNIKPLIMSLYTCVSIYLYVCVSFYIM